MVITDRTILVSLVGHDHTIEVEPIDNHIMRTAIAVSKAGAILIRRYVKTYRTPAAGSINADLDRAEYYRYIQNSMPIIVKFIANSNACKMTIAHSGLDVDGVPYSLSFTLSRMKADDVTTPVKSNTQAQAQKG